MQVQLTFQNLKNETIYNCTEIKHILLILCASGTVAADRLHGDAEPGLFPQRRFRSKHHRYIKAALFTDLNACSKAEGNGVILKL